MLQPYVTILQMLATTNLPMSLWLPTTRARVLTYLTKVLYYPVFHTNVSY